MPVLIISSLFHLVLFSSSLAKLRQFCLSCKHFGNFIFASGSVASLAGSTAGLEAVCCGFRFLLFLDVLPDEFFHVAFSLFVFVVCCSLFSAGAKRGGSACNLLQLPKIASRCRSRCPCCTCKDRDVAGALSKSPGASPICSSFSVRTTSAIPSRPALCRISS